MKETEQNSKLTGVLTVVAGKIKVRKQRTAGRRQLVSRSDHMLKDIGVNRFDAEREYGKPFWKK